MKNVLLFGGAGYIGTHVALAFLDSGWRVGIYDNLNTGRESNIPAGCEFFRADILDNESLEKALFSRRWDAVVHLAALKAAGESMNNPDSYALNNITGSLNILRACLKHGIRAFVLSSSAATYGEPKYVPIDEKHPLEPINYYGYTKVAIEENLRWYDKLKGQRFAALRYFNAAGYDTKGRMTGLERNAMNLVPIVMEVATGKRPRLEIFGNDYDTPDGTCIRDYVHVSDLAKAHVLAAEYLLEKDESLTVNLGSENGISVDEILEAARRITGREIPAVYASRRPGDPARLVASSALARNKLGWKPEYSDVDTIISSTWEVYRSNSGKTD